jgi:hypothetical protein
MDDWHWVLVQEKIDNLQKELANNKHHIDIVYKNVLYLAECIDHLKQGFDIIANKVFSNDDTGVKLH